MYRVQYPPDHLLALADQLSDLSTLERFYLFSDTWAAVLAGKSELADFLSLAEAIRDQRDPDVWGQVTGPLALMSRAVPDDLLDDLAAYARALVGPVFEQLGWEEQPDDNERIRSAARSQLLSSLGTVGADPAIRSRCAELHRAFLEDGVGARPGARSGDSDDGCRLFGPRKSTTRSSSASGMPGPPKRRSAT